MAFCLQFRRENVLLSNRRLDYGVFYLSRKPGALHKSLRCLHQNPTVKRESNAGTSRLKLKLLFIASALKQYHVGLEEVDDGICSLYFCSVLLGRIDERDYVIRI